MPLDYEFIPNFTDATPRRGINPKYLQDLTEPLIILHQAMRKGGKGVSVFGKASQLRSEGMLIAHLWGARSNENLYWAINKNCKEKYQKMELILKGFYEDIPSLKEWSLSNGLTEEEYNFYLDLLIKEKMIKADNEDYSISVHGIKLIEKKLLHCNCFKAHEILWVVPEYIEFIQDTLDRFNGVFFKDIDEYNEYFMGISFEDEELLDQGVLPKPEHMQPIPLIKIAKITPPTTGQRKGIFRKQFMKILLQARAEHRVLVMNPSMFEGQLDKFETLAEMIKMIPDIMNKSGHFSPLPKSEIKSVWDESHHKLCIILNELRSVAPSNKLSPEAKSGISKKAIVDFIPEARHYKTWFLGDYQNPEDLYGGVRYQVNYFVIKRASSKLLGKDWEWLYEKILQDREKLRYYNFKNLPEKHPRVMNFLDQKRPIISELPDNLEYVTNINNDIILVKSPVPDFHLKASLEDFKTDTGIQWRVVDKLVPVEKKSVTEKLPKVDKKSLRIKLAKKLHQMYDIDGMDWKEIEKMMKTDEIFAPLNIAGKSAKYFSSWLALNKKFLESK